MASALVERYDDRIAGVLSCYDRVVVTGTLPTVCYAEGMTRFLYANQIRIFDYPEFAMTLRDRVREAAASLAAEAGITIEHVSRATSARKQSSLRSWSSVKTILVWCM
jgi:carbamoylphosphate synthase small subunit